MPSAQKQSVGEHGGQAFKTGRSGRGQLPWAGVSAEGAGVAGAIVCGIWAASCLASGFSRGICCAGACSWAGSAVLAGSDEIASWADWACWADRACCWAAAAAAWSLPMTSC